ncbi:hypothetical protein [Aquabacterium sp. J223]|uniref:hypothetical protein n=1 Tax=Aquabacterium sp. J223 TaxID=2898431 RepID=UPI0021ADEEFD|nr:hypothetical protein [Aquabacterium sp. J223]UUX97438.1 hypothetical protein LRS07_09485 [Aquabacterium sp. J223]
MPAEPLVIHLQPLAPPKPAPGAACNGCGVCCSVEPCPVGVLLSGRRRGACRLLRWDALGGLYRCGLLAVSPRTGLLRRAARAYARRLIAAGRGCDSDCTVDVAG